MESLTFEKAKWSYGSDGFWLSLKVENRQAAQQFVEEMKDKPYTAELKEFRQKRSLDANAYCWVLIGKLAAVLRISPNEVYREAIQNIGGNYEILPIKENAVERWKQIWQGKGIGWICEVIGESKLRGYMNVRCLYGSSVYDTQQMSRLIDTIVFECKQQGIETATPEELMRMKEEWQ